jgi:phosphatidate cytidylyltransferase
MLKQRVVTAIVLLALVLGVIAGLPPAGFLVCMGAVILLGAWEWTRLAGLASPAARIMYVALVAVLLPLLYLQEPVQRRFFLAAGCLWWVYAYFLVRRFPALGRLWQQRWLPCIAGLLVLLPGWSALVALRASPHYLALILLMLALVAAADIGAYFAGRAFGRHKLAPHVSPNKTWEGFAGGMCASCLVALAFVTWADTGLPLAPLLLLKVLAAALSIAVVSVVGDLFESMVKRMAGVKDSGSLLPGHGGVLDRIDSITAALPLFTLTLNWFVVA